MPSVKKSPIAVIAAVALIIAGCAADPTGPDIARNVSSIGTSKYSAEDETEYLLRYARLQQSSGAGEGLSAYDPLETVRGAADAQPLPSAQPTEISGSAIASARAYAAKRNSSAFLIWHDGKLVEETYFGDFERATPLVSKSMAKPVTALLVGRAIEQGHIESLDQPVADFITEWQGDEGREKIRIRHLLDMRTGLLPQGSAPGPEHVLNRAYLHPRHDEVIINDYPLVDTPGSRYGYSNATSELVAPVIERATGMRYSNYLTRELLEPIGAAGGSVWVNREGGTAHSGCCLLLPAQSWVRMAMLLINDGVWDGNRLLPEEYVAEMRRGTAQNQYYGMGLWLAGTYTERRGFAHPDVPYGKVLHSEPYLDKDIFLFDGNSNQVVYIIPSQNLIVLRMGERPPADAEWDNSYIPNLLIRALD